MKARFFTAAIAIGVLGLTGCNKESVNDLDTQTGKSMVMPHLPQNRKTIASVSCFI